MNNSSTVILNKTIKELETKRESIEQELYNVNNTIVGIKSILLGSEDNSGPSIKTAPKQSPRKKRRRKYKQTKRVLITENSVRDAIIELVKNPAPNFSGIHKLDTGFFTVSQIAKQIGVTPSTTINRFMNKFEEKSLLESRVYKNGKQYRYIKPIDSGIDNIQSPAETRAERSISNPIPGTNNNIHTRDKDIEKLLRAAANQGLVVTRLGTNHIRVSTADLKKSVSVSATEIGRASCRERV